MNKSMLKTALFICVLFATACKTGSEKQAAVATPEKYTGTAPAPMLQGNIYEVNLRQYTPEGTIEAFAQHLDRLKDMGVQTIWFMPINPISKKDRKGSMGSYYAVSDYTALNPEFGELGDFKRIVNAIHARSMQVIIDWVPNHTGADHRWLKEHPDFFVRDKNGKAAMAKDWADTRQLDYSNPVMQDSMIAAMKFWLDYGIDGFRCDVAWNVPASFWQKAIPELNKQRELFWLAEGDSAYLAQSGFHAVYPWHMFKMLEKIAKGERPAFAIDSVLKESDSLYPKQTMQLYFTSNHDENSWNKADYGSFPGDIHAPFSVLTQTLVNSIPLVYSGQEEPVLRAIKFFDKDTIEFANLKRASFYKSLLNLRKRNAALATYATFTRIGNKLDPAIYAYIRQNGNDRVLVLLNFSASQKTIDIKELKDLETGIDAFTGEKTDLGSQTERVLKPWGYEVWELKPEE